MEYAEVKVINQSSNPMPAYATEGSSGFDLRADLPASVVLEPMERKLIPTGLFVEIPNGLEAQIRSRSGLAINHGVACLNSPGTIDSDYRGEIKVILINFSQENFTINSGDRIAQMVISPVVKTKLIEVSAINSTERGHGGFGHTGRN